MRDVLILFRYSFERVVSLIEALKEPRFASRKSATKKDWISLMNHANSSINLLPATLGKSTFMQHAAVIFKGVYECVVIN